MYLLKGFIITTAIICTFLWMSSCKKPQPSRPMEGYLIETDSIQPLSEIQIPFTISEDTLETMLNRQMSGTIFEDNNLNGENISVRAKKVSNIIVRVASNNIKYTVPLDLWIQKRTMLANLDATGQIALNFKTDFIITPDWNIKTTTTVEGYQWLASPKLKMGYIELPIDFIANTILRRSKDQLSKSIDQQLANQLNFKPQLQQAWKMLHKPIEISSEFKTWLTLYPTNIAMRPLMTIGKEIKTGISIQCRPEISLGQTPIAPYQAPLPPFAYASGPDKGIEMIFRTLVPYTEAERLANLNMKGFTYKQGSRSVTVQNIEMYGQNEYLVVGTELSGSYNGKIYLKGIPSFDTETNRVVLRNLSYDFSTQKILMKSATWLFGGSLEKLIQENLDFYLQYNMTTMKSTIQSEIDKMDIGYGMQMKSSIDALELKKVSLNSTGIVIRVGMKGKTALRL